MNIELLEKVRKHILEEPKRVNMKEWLINSHINDFEIKRLKKINKAPKCNTVGCIAGWAQQLCSKKKLHSFDRCKAKNLLELDINEADRLFLLKKMTMNNNHWPFHFEDELKKHTPGTRAYARIVAKRIKHFINTEGRE